MVDEEDVGEVVGAAVGVAEGEAVVDSAGATTTSSTERTTTIAAESSPPNEALNGSLVAQQVRLRRREEMDPMSFLSKPNHGQLTAFHVFPMRIRRQVLVS